MEVVVPDFGLARVPDFTTAALSGYQAGRTIGRERRTEAALKSFQTDPEAGIRAASFDPKLSNELRTQNDARKTRELTASAFEGGREDGLPINLNAVRELAKIDPDMGMKVYEFAQKATADDLKLAADHAEIKGQAATYLQSIPEGPERIAAFEALKPELVQRGFKPEDLAQARLDSESLKRDQAFGMSMKDLIDQQRIRYQPIGEGGLQATDYLGRPVEAPIGVAPPADGATPNQGPEGFTSITPQEAASVKASFGAGGQEKFADWARKNRIVVASGNGKRLSNGTIAYEVNGKLYDNPEGR